MKILGIHSKKKRKNTLYEQNCSISIENFPFPGKIEAEY